MTERDSFGRYPIHHAAVHGTIEDLHREIDAGADVNAVDYEGATPLNFASHRGRVDIINALVEAGADINAGDDKGRTPLYWAMSADHRLEVIALLRSRGADATAKSYKSYFGEMSVLDLVQDSASRGNDGLVPAFEDLL